MNAHKNEHLRHFAMDWALCFMLKVKTPNTDGLHL